MAAEGRRASRFVAADLGRSQAALTPFALFQPVAVAVHLQDMDVVGHPVEQCAGQLLRSEHAGPLVEWQVRGDNDRAPLVALAEDLEQQLGAGLRQRHVAELVDHQQLVGGKLALQPQQPLLVAGLEQLVPPQVDDEPEILPSSRCLICNTGPDAGQ